MAKTMIERERELEVRRQADVLVVGGGIAGIAAALAAAQSMWRACRSTWQEAALRSIGAISRRKDNGAVRREGRLPVD